VFPKIRVPPNHQFNKVFHYKPSILGVFPLFLVQHPYKHHFLVAASESIRFFCLSLHESTHHALAPKECIRSNWRMPRFQRNGESWRRCQRGRMPEKLEDFFVSKILRETNPGGTIVGKWTLWRCISYWTSGYSIAIRLFLLKNLRNKSPGEHHIYYWSNFYRDRKTRPISLPQMVVCLVREIPP